MQLAPIPQPALGHPGNRQHGEAVRVTVLQESTVELVEALSRSPEQQLSYCRLLYFRDGTLIGQTDCMRRDMLADKAGQ